MHRCRIGIAALSGALLLASGPADAAVKRTQSDPIDRQLLQDDDFCSPLIVDDGQRFLADGIEVTVELRVRNLGTTVPGNRAAQGGNLWMFHAIDALSIVREAIYGNYVENNPVCFDPCGNGPYLRWDLVPFPDLVYLETFDNFIPAEWSLDDGAYFNFANDPQQRTSSNDLDQGDCFGDRNGGSLGLGLPQGDEFAGTYATLGGLTPGEEYRFNWWWRAWADSSFTNGDLWVTIWGEEPWEDRTPAGLTKLGSTWGAAWGDYDGDSDPDLYLSRSAGSVPKNQLWRNDGGTLVEATPVPLLDTGDASGASWADVDNDGDPDLYLGNWSGGSRMWRNDGAGSFVDVTTPAVDPGPGVVHPSWADWDLDGDLDLFLVRATAQNHLLRNDGSFQFTDITSGDALGLLNSTAASWADYDLDGDPDVYVTHFSIQNQLLRNDGGGTFVDAATGPLGVLAEVGPGTGCAWADFDHDGDFDLFSANDFGDNRLYENVGAGASFLNIEPPLLKDAQQSQGASWADVDLDGDQDLFLARFAEQNSLFRNDGGNNWTETIGGPFPMTNTRNSLGGAFADTDLDGDPDLFVQNLTGTDDLYVRNDGAVGQHWLAVDLEGTISNRDGIGARIELLAGGTRQTRYVSSGASYYVQNERRQLFGLGGETVIQELVVRWPSGLVQYVTPPSVDQRIVVVEGAGTSVTGGEEAALRLDLAAPRPNPFGEEVTLRFTLPQRGDAELRILDVAGRRIRDFAVRGREAGAHELRWDGRDGSGRVVPAGVYFVRLEAAGDVRTQKVVRLPNAR